MLYGAPLDGKDMTGQTLCPFCTMFGPAANNIPRPEPFIPNLVCFRKAE